MAERELKKMLDDFRQKADHLNSRIEAKALSKEIDKVRKDRLDEISHESLFDEFLKLKNDLIERLAGMESVAE